MAAAELAQRLAYWLERRAWLADMRPDDTDRLAALDQLIARLERALAGHPA